MTDDRIFATGIAAATFALARPLTSAEMARVAPGLRHVPDTLTELKAKIAAEPTHGSLRRQASRRWLRFPTTGLPGGFTHVTSNV